MQIKSIFPWRSDFDILKSLETIEKHTTERANFTNQEIFGLERKFVTSNFDKYIIRKNKWNIDNELMFRKIAGK